MGDFREPGPQLSPEGSGARSLGRVKHALHVALLVNRPPVLVKFALVQVDGVETDGTQEGLLSAHRPHPRIANTIPLVQHQCKKKVGMEGEVGGVG